jgi:hypothetical protein
MTRVRIVPMSSAGDLVSLVSRRSEGFVAATLGPVTHRALASAVSGAVRVLAVHGKRKLRGRIRPSRFVSTRPRQALRPTNAPDFSTGPQPSEVRNLYALAPGRAHVRFGSEAEILKASTASPLYPRKRTSDLRLMSTRPSQARTAGIFGKNTGHAVTAKLEGSANAPSRLGPILTNFATVLPMSTFWRIVGLLIIIAIAIYVVFGALILGYLQ